MKKIHNRRPFFSLFVLQFSSAWEAFDVPFRIFFSETKLSSRSADEKNPSCSLSVHHVLVNPFAETRGKARTYTVVHIHPMLFPPSDLQKSKRCIRSERPTAGTGARNPIPHTTHFPPRCLLLLYSRRVVLHNKLNTLYWKRAILRLRRADRVLQETVPCN